MKPTESMKPYVHSELGRTVSAIGGHYTFNKEVRLPFREGEVLYLVGYGVLDTSCCGMGGCGYARVLGYIVSWKSRINKDGFCVSILTPINDLHAQKQLTKIIEKNEMVQQVLFA
jgi:hypothetical protein